jgi:hypothetical protein
MARWWRRRFRFTPDGTGLTSGAPAGNGGNGRVTLSYTVDPGCAAVPASGSVLVAPRFTG